MFKVLVFRKISILDGKQFVVKFVATDLRFCVTFNLNFQQVLVKDFVNS